MIYTDGLNTLFALAEFMLLGALGFLSRRLFISGSQLISLPGQKPRSLDDDWVGPKTILVAILALIFLEYYPVDYRVQNPL